MTNEFTLPGAEPSYAPDLALEPVHIALSLNVDIEAKRIAGRATTSVRANRVGTRTLILNAVGFVAAEVSGPLSSRYDGRQLTITWDTPFAEGETREVAVDYAVEAPVSGMHFSHPDDRYPDRPVFACSDHETERARYWLPCVDYPAVRTTFDFAIRVAADLTVLANGVQDGETEHGDGTKTTRWTLDFRCPSYLCCLAVGRFTRYVDEAVDGIPIEYYAAQRIPEESLAGTFGRTGELMRWLVGRLGVPFPFGKYFQIALPGVGGAMENISLVTWDEMFVQDESFATEWREFVDSINIHEMAHSYFGDAVVCRHFEHSWLKESWATYIETVWREETVGRDDAHYKLHLDAEHYIAEADSQYVRPIVTRHYDSSWDLFDNHLYPGGAWRLHMLRKHVGDEAFWLATRDYLELYHEQVVETEDFRRVVEVRAGLNLVRFFDEWVLSRGYPKLKATFQHDAEKGEARLVVEQIQEDEKKGVGKFRLSLAVEYVDDDGAHRVALAVDDTRQTLRFSVQGKCAMIRIDPDCEALFKLEFNPGDDLLCATLTGADDVRNRIRAGQELIKSGTRANLAAVRAAMAAEPFWGVRAALAKALGECGHAAAIPVLAERLLSEEEPRAKQVLAAACGGLRDRRLAAALRDFIARPQAPLAHSTALLSLGAQRDEADRALLVSRASDTSLHGMVASGALRGLGRLGALDQLAGRMGYGEHPEASRVAAVEGYGLAAQRARREERAEAVERLIDMTRDGQSRVRVQAGMMLASLGDRRAIPALESLKAMGPEQDAASIERWIRKLNKGEPVDGALADRVDKLEERCRKMQERLDEIEGGA
ncbi:MAG: hypothetical protein HOL51_04650 [Gemmatimonadetes bacterium]|jgi:aminopeptidase N|nr:hypothetical protein [Gemmatimonadota bacterium]MBT5325395.1 hypothetical protein [Gemmatimonadota bacterium]MBT5448981.1 hypothetical protein [Gemmatimonadota bacterium]MBT5800571.1 hypothetical protein [Gemmatimonadota bacterium]MBT6622729.1 hypothetical protein [Gemmatimonadota bacterium]